MDQRDLNAGLDEAAKRDVGVKTNLSGVSGTTLNAGS